MTKSPRAVAQEALRLAQDALPPYSAVRSRKGFTPHQLFAILALKTFLKTDYRGVVAFRRGGGTGPFGGKYRNQMVRRFRPRPEGSRHKRVYGQRWQVESAFSRHKRWLGSALFGRSDESRTRECYLRVLTHNIMLLAAHN